MNHSVQYRDRIKERGEVPGYFHCMSRVVAGERLLGLVEQEVFRRMMWKQAAFCGVQIITYAIMSNHFHILVRVDPPRDLSDEELLERVGYLYDESKVRIVRRWFADEIEGPRARQRLLKRMHDVSFFLKELKQRFTLWYNDRHDRFGTLWAEKFKSVLVEGEPEILMKVAGYIDLNPVRAGFCRDPKNYRFCGYGEAVGGGADARSGLRSIYFGKKDWRAVQRAYRLLLFGKGYHADLKHGRISEEALRRAIEEKGELSVSQALHCRVQYFTEGLVLGSTVFVERIFREKRKRYWKKRTDPVVPLKGAKWGGLCVLNRSSKGEV